MSAFYNENDPKAAAWLRELVKRGLIADGIVDERSITEVQADDLEGFAQVHLFAGIGGWSYALRLAGWPDERPVWTGSCPCQPFSCAGTGGGTADARHLWPEFFRLIKERRPSGVLGEQVASGLGLRWLAGVRADLEAEGYAFAPVDLGAASVAAPHIRQRIWWVADAERERGRRGNDPREDAVHVDARREAPGPRGTRAWMAVEPRPRPLAHGVPARVGRLRGYGNAIVPQVAAEFIRAYCGSVTQ